MLSLVLAVWILQGISGYIRWAVSLLTFKDSGLNIGSVKLCVVPGTTQVTSLVLDEYP